MARNSRDREIYPITIRELQVADIEDITPGMRRITLTGDQLRAHSAFGVDAPPLVSDGFDDDIRIIFPDPATGERPHPITREDATVLWQEEVKDLFRTYTVRSFDASRGRLVVDFARHGQGLAEEWSTRVQLGDLLYIAGPKSCAALPTHTPWLLMVGDETALPAIARCVETLPAGYRAVVIIEVATRANVQRLDFEAQVEIHWQVRDEGRDVIAKVAELYGDRPEWATKRATMPYVWAAGEAGRLKVLRRWVRALGIPRENVEITGYWRAAPPVESGAEATAVKAPSAGQAAETVPQGDNAGPETAGTSQRNAVAELHELTEMGSAILVRQAVGLGIFGLIDEGADRVDQLAEATGLQPDSVLRIARYLEAVGVVTLSADVVLDSASDGMADQRPVRIGLTTLGSELANPDSRVRDWITGPAAAKTAALSQLGYALQNPVATGEYRWDYIVQVKPQLAVEEHEQAASSAQWSAPAAAEILSGKLSAQQDTGSLRCAVGGPAAAVYADEFLRKVPQGNAVVLGSFSEAEDSARISVGEATAGITESGTSVEEIMLCDIAPRRRDRARYSALYAPTVGSRGDEDARRADWNATAASLCEQVDAVVLVDPWRRWPAVELQQLVATVLRSGAQLFLVTPVLRESGAEDHDYEEDLSRLVLYGSRLPTSRVIAQHLAAVGAVVRSQQPVGWSAQLFEVGC